MRKSDSILIVDDNPNNLQVLTGILQAEGYKVRPALSGAIALRAMDAGLPDLILLDVRMPEMDGYETCRQIKLKEGGADVPVIFISALNETEDKLNAFHAGAVDYITKPFRSEEVLARVHTQLELANTRNELAASNERLRTLMEQLVQFETLKSLGFLAAGVAHELNTPIGNAMLAASVIDTRTHDFRETHAAALSEPGLNEFLLTCREGSELIERNLNRASALIRALKNVSVDHASERRRTIDLRATVDDFCVLQNNRISQTPYSVVIDIEPGLTLETYPGYLEQILDNLIQNAIIHGFDGAASGCIRLSAHGSDEGKIVLCVTDNGKGIAPHNLKHVFDPFFTTRLGQGGSGLGLHIAYSLATGALGGSLSVASTEGQGAVFTLTLPKLAPIPESDDSMSVQG